MPWFERDGSRIYFEEHGAGDPLLLLHGWAGNMDALATVRGALAARYRVIAVDTPGCGKSEPKPREYVASYHHDDAATFLALLEELKVMPVHVVGFSDGGDYGLLMAVMRPDLVRSVATWGAGGSLPGEPGSMDSFDNLIDEPIEPMKQFSEYLRATYGVDNARVMAQSAAKAWEEILRAGGDISRSRAAEIRCPCLLVVGENDFLCPPALASGMAAAIPNGEFAQVPNAAHSLHQEAPDALISLLAGWLAGIS